MDSSIQVKTVNVLGDTIVAAKDNKGQIWAGVSYLCKALGMSNKQRDNQVTKVQNDKTLKQGSLKFQGGVFDQNNEAIGIRIDFIPLWLAKIQITDRMEDNHPELAKKLLDYQLKAKDILANAFVEKKKSTGEPATLQQQIQLIAQGTTELYQKVDTLAERMDNFEQNLPLLPEDADDVSKEVKKRVVEVLGGKDSNAYHDKSLSQKVFMDAYRNLKSNFDVSSYKAIKRNRKNMAVQIAREYKPPLYLAEQIQAENSQMKFL